MASMFAVEIALHTITPWSNPAGTRIEWGNGVIYGTRGTCSWPCAMMALTNARSAMTARPARYHHHETDLRGGRRSPTGSMPGLSSNVSRVDSQPRPIRQVPAEVLSTWRWPVGCESWI
jgi:hypothetical protein